LRRGGEVGSSGDRLGVDGPFIGSEALVDGAVANKHQLRTRFRAIYPDVYLPRGVTPTLAQRTTAAWLWSHRRGVVAGLAASAMHGSRWIPDNAPVELIWTNARVPRGIRTRRDRLLPGEHQSVAGMHVTTPERTAFDLGRLTRRDEAVARLDALANAAGFDRTAVVELAHRHRGSPGLPRLLSALDLYDAGAQSPRETWLRLMLVRAGFPRPQTQIPICDEFGYPRYFLDMGWDEVMIAVEYDGDHHRERPVFTNDIVRSEYIAYRGWTHIRVVAGARPADIVNRVRRAWRSSVRPDREIA
jgi:very-short-patch-repair endonuclease